MTIDRKILTALFPRGSAWAPKYDGGFDRLLNGIADCFGIVRTAAAALANIRHPLSTSMLDDLEREFGVVPDLTASESARRQYLQSVVYSKISVGSAADLEARLRLAGFDVRVYRNDPGIDPALLISTAIAASCGDPDSTCGAPLVTCSRGDDGTGLLLLNEKLLREELVYRTPDDNHYFPFVFFVGGERTGWEWLKDWNMELAHVAAWTDYGGALLTKNQALYYPGGGIRSLQIQGTGLSLDQQSIQPQNPDADMCAFLRADDDGGTIYNLAWLNSLVDGNMEKPCTDVIVDGDMEAAGVAAWTVGPGGAGSSLAKIGGAYEGAQCLRITNNASVTPYAAQTILTVGRSYRVRGVAKPRVVATEVPRVILLSGTVLWTGSTATTDWQPFDITFVADDTSIALQSDNTLGGLYSIFDDVSVLDLTTGCTDWTIVGDARAEKHPAGVTGRQCLRVSTGNPAGHVEQTVMVDATDYRITGWARGSGTAAPEIHDGGGRIWGGTTSTDWQEIDVSFTSTGTDIEFHADTTDDWVEFDDLMLNELVATVPVLAPDATATDTDNAISPRNAALDFDGVSAVVDASAVNTGLFGYENLTLCGWFHLRDPMSQQGLITNGTLVAADAMVLEVNGGNISWSTYIDGATVTLSTPASLQESWRCFVAATRAYDGVYTTSRLYVAGVLMAEDIRRGAPGVPDAAVIIGHTDGLSTWYDGIIDDNVSLFGGEKSAAWIAAEYQRGITAMLGGPSAGQILETPVYDSRAFQAYAWSIFDGGGDCGVPAIAVRSGMDWEIIWIGVDANDPVVGTDRQDIYVALDTSIHEVRLLCKGTAAAGAVAFDDVRFDNLEIARAVVPATMRDRFERLILASKPVHAWAALLVDYS